MASNSLTFPEIGLSKLLHHSKICFEWTNTLKHVQVLRSVRGIVWQFLRSWRYDPGFQRTFSGRRDQDTRKNKIELNSTYKILKTFRRPDIPGFLSAADSVTKQCRWDKEADSRIWNLEGNVWVWLACGFCVLLGKSLWGISVDPDFLICKRSWHLPQQPQSILAETEALSTFHNLLIANTCV